MNWFEGSIPDAINEAKRRSLVFVVVITGDDAQSTELLSTWDDPHVTEAAQGCVAIRLHDKR
uniref:UBX domain-containing protein n=1 Tax=Periophthalmus magnuspinnatus TaxID=409849 RepID=A0A3B3ZH73_9GOBI